MALDDRPAGADPLHLIAELRRERDEALAREAAIAEVLQVINASPGDLAPVFEAMLEKASRLCDAPNGQLAIYDGEFFRFVAAHGEASHVHDLLARGTMLPVSGTTWPQIVAGEHVVHIPDVRESEHYRVGHENTRKFVEVSGGRSLLTVALRKDNVLMGALSVYRRHARPFTDKQIALLENFAAQAVIAMENARLITETREALEQQTATAEVLGIINASPGDLAPVFDLILEKAHSLCGAASRSLLVCDDGQFRALSARGLNAEIMDLLRTGFRPSPEHPMSRLFGGDRFVHVADVAEVNDPGARAGFEIGGMRTLLWVPLRKDDALLGAIVATRQEVRPFSEQQIALLQSFAGQAVIAMENARLLTETREALEQQTATAEVLGVINSSPGDLAPVFGAMLEKATSLSEAAFGILWLCEGERLHAAALHGVPDSYAEVARTPIQPRPDNPLGRMRRGERLIVSTDVADEEPYRAGDPARRALVDIGGARSAVQVALVKDGNLLGSLTVFRQEVRPFSDKQIALLQNFAAQAVIAMENARLITETREALEQQTATAEVLGVINASPGDLAPVFDAILERAMSRCEAAFGFMTIYDGQVFTPCAMRNVPEPLAEYFSKGMDQPQHGDAHWQLLQGADLVHNVDQKADDAYRSGNPLRRAVVDLGGTRTALVVALRKDGVLRGTLTLYRQEVRPFADKQIALLQNFAAQAVIAMENARLITETREALEQQTATAEVLGVINSSPGDLAPVFDAIVEKAMHLCDASFGFMVVSDGKAGRTVATRGVPDEYAKFRKHNPVQPGQAGIAARISAGEPFVHTLDLKNDDLYRHGDPQRRAMVDLGGARSSLVVALKKGPDTAGTISVYRQEVRAFSEKQIALLQNFAAQAVIAMENARLLGELRQRTEEVAELNRGLEARVAEQVEELGRVGRLKRFLAPQLAELIVSQGDEKILESHRCEIVVVFCDLRGYTAFTETAEPEEVLDFLREYHGALGPLVEQFEGTLDQFSGDGIMVFFNDPVPIPDPAERAVTMAVAMREAAGALIASWRRRGRELGFGAGIAQGYATLGQIGFAERSGYTAIGTVCNLAARLCAEAKDGQILIAQRVAAAVEQTMALETIGSLTLKGLTQPVVAFNVPNTATPSNRPERATPSAPAG